MSEPHYPPAAPPPYQSGPAPAASAPFEPPPKYEAKAGQPYPASGYGGQPYPPQGYQAAPSTTIYTQPVTVIQMQYGAHPTTINCQYCHNHVTTSVMYEPGALSWIVSGLLCLFGCWLGCCLIPFCISDLQDAIHVCPNCRNRVGVFRRLQ